MDSTCKRGIDGLRPTFSIVVDMVDCLTAASPIYVMSMWCCLWAVHSTGSLMFEAEDLLYVHRGEELST